MKKFMIFCLGCLSISSSAQQDRTWSLGAQWGFQGNHSFFSGGMENANARFTHNPFGGGALNLIARYDYNKHWMLMTGLGLNTFGFEFALSENYSLHNEDRRSSTLRSEFGAFEIPVMLYYKFNPNCRNSKLVLGAGFVHSFTGQQIIAKNYIQDNEGNTNSNYLKSEASANGGLYTMLRFSVGREKLFNRGSILNASMVFNLGFKELARAKVTYTVDGQEYQHEFVNSGNFIGFRLTYFFKPFTR